MDMAYVREFSHPQNSLFFGSEKNPPFLVPNEMFGDMDVSKNNGTPKSSILIGFSIINNPFWGAPFLETPIWLRPDLGVTKCVGVNLYEIQYQAHGVICTINLIPLSMTARGGEKYAPVVVKLDSRFPKIYMGDFFSKQKSSKIFPPPRDA